MPVVTEIYVVLAVNYSNKLFLYQSHSPLMALSYTLLTSGQSILSFMQRVALLANLF
jgi:hypothetical protein